MKYIKIVATGSSIPNRKVTNKEIEKELSLEKNYIEKRTGIKERFFIEKETIENLAIQSAKDLIEKIPEEKIQKIDLIIVATTTVKNLMPGIANAIQKELKIKKCISFDILAGCSGYINALDIAKNYIQTGDINTALIVGVDTLSLFTNKKDISTTIHLSEGAKETLIKSKKIQKIYEKNIEVETQNNEILTCNIDKKIEMKGLEIYRYAVTKTVQNINELLKKSNQTLNDIKYIIPHQSNLKIIKAIITRLNINEDKVYTNLQNIGNTFCASIPIALDEMLEKNLLKEGDKIILIGYGGGLNTGSILLEI